MKKISYLTIMAMLAAPVLFSGCGGGASADLTVTIIPDEVGSDSSDGDSGGSQAAAPEGFGTIKGKVVFKGTVPSLSPLVQAGAKVADAAICSASPVPNDRLVVSDDGGVANTFIYMDRVPKGVEVPEIDKQDVVFDQKNCRFTPHAIIVRTEVPFMVMNSDPIAHNTHTYPKKNPGFSGLVDKNGREFVYDKQESVPFEVKCDLHAWMTAYHLPLDHPYGAVSNESGEFEITDVPAGKQEFRVWHEAADGGFLERKLKVEVKPDETATVMVEFPAEKFSGN